MGKLSFKFISPEKTVIFYERRTHILLSETLSYLKLYLALFAAERDNNTLAEMI